MKAHNDQGYIIGLDVGSKRIGVALAHQVAAIPSPIGVLAHDEHVWDELSKLIAEHDVVAIVVGLPRGLDGQETAQTTQTRQFIETLKKHTKLPVHLQDEAVTSVLAEQSLRANGKRYNKGMVDALAATLILEDFLKKRG